MQPRVDAVALADHVLSREFDLEIGRCYSRAWDTLCAHFWPIMGVSVLLWLLMALAGVTYLAFFLTGPLAGGLSWYYLRSIRGEKPGIEDAFAGFTGPFLQLMLASMVMCVLLIVAFVCCIVPSIYLGVAWALTYLLLIEYRLGFWEGMEACRRVSTRHWWSLFLLIVLNILINFAGGLCCGVGLLITAPWTGLALACAYDEIFGRGRAPQPGLGAVTPAAPAPTLSGAPAVPAAPPAPAAPAAAAPGPVPPGFSPLAPVPAALAPAPSGPHPAPQPAPLTPPEVTPPSSPALPTA
jgi:hypothetical protein